MLIDWPSLTEAKAKRLLPSARAAERRAAERYERTGAATDEAAMLSAWTDLENLMVFIHTGEKPDGQA